MQTATGTLLAAIQSRVRRPVARVKADWKRDGSYAYNPGVFRDLFSNTFEGSGDIGDLSGWITSVSVDRSLSTDLPDTSKVVSGSGSASANVTIAGTLTCGTGLMQALRAGQDWLARLNTPVTIDLGFVGTTGAEYLRSFTGKVRSITINPGDASITLSMLDYREKVRKPVSLTVTTGQVGSYFMSAIATANGVTLTGESSLNTGVATAVVTTSDPWSVLQQLAEAEQGVILFDESGTLIFYNRNHMSGGTAVATITTVDNLKALTSEETVDAVANYVTVGATPLALTTAGGVIWSVDTLITITPWQTALVPVDTGSPLYSVTAIGFVASYFSDGSGASATGVVTASYAAGSTASTGTIALTNNSGSTVWMVYNSTTPGTGIGNPSVWMLGQVLTPATDSDFLAVRQDPASQATYGVQTLDVTGNPWRQSPDAAQNLALALLVALKEPHPTLSSVDVIGDPRLQLADRVRVVEPDGLVLDGDFWCVGITTTLDSSGLSQSVVLREA